MLPEVGALEYLIIAAVALIVVGPKDLPMLLRRLGQFVAKLRGMASEFRASFDEMARQSELDDLRKEVEAMRRGQFDDMGAHEMRTIASDIESSIKDVGVSFDGGVEAYNYDDDPKRPAAAPPVTIGEAPKPKRARAAKPKPVPAAEAAPAPKARRAAPKAAPPKAAAPKTVAGRTPRAKKTAEAGS